MIIYPRKTRVFTKSSSKNGHSEIQLRYYFIITPFYYYTKHGGRIGSKILLAKNYFCSFSSFELKLCRMVELCIPKNPIFVFFDFNVF